MLKWIKKNKEFNNSDVTRLSKEQRGMLAQQILENPIYKECIKIIENELNTLWINSPTGDKETREQVFHMRKMLQKIDLKFKGLLNEAIHNLKNGSAEAPPHIEE